MGAHIGFPGFAIYHSTKWGVEGYFEELAKEIALFGISTILVEPGLVRTSFYDAVERVPPSEPYFHRARSPFAALATIASKRCSWVPALLR